jgi:hypothetical protein
MTIYKCGEVHEGHRHLFEGLNGSEGFWGGDIVHMLLGANFADWRREELQTLPGMRPWVRNANVGEEVGIYIEAWPFKVTTYVETFPRIELTALQEHVDHKSAQNLLAGILGYELTPATTAGVWIGKGVVAELKGRIDAENPTKLIITYTDGLLTNA